MSVKSVVWIVDKNIYDAKKVARFKNQVWTLHDLIWKPTMLITVTRAAPAMALPLLLVLSYLCCLVINKFQAVKQNRACTRSIVDAKLKTDIVSCRQIDGQFMVLVVTAE